MKKIILIILLFTISIYSQTYEIPLSNAQITNALQSGLNFASGNVKVEDYIGALDTSLGWSLVIQAAVDANLGSGKNLLFEGNKLYELQVQKTNPYNNTLNVCVDLKTGGVNIIIPSTTIIKLKDGQQTDAGGAVDLIVFRNASNIYIGGGGKIIGNTAGQTDWTQGYMQLSAGCLIRGYSNPPGIWGLGSNIIIENLELNDHFSNPADISGVSNLIMRDLRCHAVGEGFGASFCDDVLFDNLMVNDSTTTFVGDAIEVVRCFDFKIINCTVEQNEDGGAAAFDLGGSWSGLVDNFNIRNWQNGGFSLGTSFGYKCHNIVIQNGMYINDELPVGSGVALESGEGEITYRNILIKNVPQGFVAKSLGNNIKGGKQRVLGCTFINTNATVYGDRVVEFNECAFDSSGFNTAGTGAIAVGGWDDGDSAYVEIINCKFTNSDAYAIHYPANGKTGLTPQGIVANNVFYNSGNRSLNLPASHLIRVQDNIMIGSDLFNQAGGAGILPTAGADLELIVTGGYHYHTISNFTHNQKITIKYILDSGTYSLLYDKDVYGSGNIDLSDNLNRNMSNGDAITLIYDTSAVGWREINFFSQKAGNNVQIIDGWYYQDVSDSLTTSVMSRGTTNRFYLTRDCYIRAIGIQSNEPRSAGTLTAYITVDGGGYFTAVLDGTNTQYKLTRVNRADGYLISAGSYLGIHITTSGDWSPTTADITGWIELEY